MPNFEKMFKTLAASEQVTIKYKDEDFLMTLLGRVMFCMPDFMESVTMTFRETIYFPSRKWVERDWPRSFEVLCHELVHVEDYRKKGWKFLLSYTMPQGLAVLSLLGLVIGSWWPALFLLFLAPIPSPWRKEAEMRGYAMTMAVHFWVRGHGIPSHVKAAIAPQFTGSNYYFMWPFRKSVEKEIGRWSKKILCNELEAEGPVFGRVMNFILSHVV